MKNLLSLLSFVVLPACGSAPATAPEISAFTLDSPVSGTVTAVNSELNDAPEKVNVDANGTWMLKLDIKDASELDKLLTASEYEAFVSEETGH